MDLGGFRRGTDMGPSAIRIAGITSKLEALGYSVRDLGDIRVAPRETIAVGSPKAHFLSHIRDSCEELRLKVLDSLESGHLPLVIGGDHSIAVGSIAGTAGFYRQRSAALGLIWVDAHADMNTPESSPSGNVHGMPLSIVLGLGAEELVRLGGFAPKVDPRHVALIGIRDVDREERRIVSESGVHVFTMKEVDRFGMNEVAQRALEAVGRGTAGIHVSVDLDAIDPDVAPGVATPARGGLTYRETHLLMELIADSRKMVAMDVVEHNPVLDSRNFTAEIAVEMVLSALGRSIL